VEVDALYKRSDTTQHEFFNPFFGSITRLSANSWEFPMQIKYQWNVRFRPFASAGGTFRHIAGFDASEETFTFGLTPPYSVVRYRLHAPLTDGGIVVGAGLALWSAGRFRIAPQFRYTRWTSVRFLPTQNQVEFLLGLSFAP